MRIFKIRKYFQLYKKFVYKHHVLVSETLRIKTGTRTKVWDILAQKIILRRLLSKNNKRLEFLKQQYISKVCEDD